MVMLRFLSCAPMFLAFPPPPPLLLITLNLPCRLAADALLGMVNSDLLLLLCRRRACVLDQTCMQENRKQIDISDNSILDELRVLPFSTSRYRLTLCKQAWHEILL
jgi:hypothetical protein